MDGSNGAGSRINSFALVSYLPQPLAGFLDALRFELEPLCHAKSHVTVLPPRPLASTAQEAWQELRVGLEEFSPFQVELQEIEIFDVSNVVYLSLGAGSAQLKSMHSALNTGQLSFIEPFDYHPHITLAQDLDSSQAQTAAALAAERWSGFTQPRSFAVDQITFVQNTRDNRWVDLAGRALSISLRSKHL